MDLTAVFAALILLVNTAVAAISVSRNRRYAAAYRRLRRIEPSYLDSLDWMYEVQVRAAREGRRHLLPPLPPSLRASELDDEDDEFDPELLRLQRAERRDPPA